MADPQATWCATLVDEWARCGVTLAVVSPGSRSTPLALALERDPRIHVDVVLDERAAAFVGLGFGKAARRPALLLCTSGTAAAQYTPAVIEAHMSGVPLLVVTADRAVELRDVGAPQAVDQQHLFGRAARWFSDPGPIESAANSQWWRSFASRAYNATLHAQTPGPVHLNLAFREPLVADAGEIPPGRRADMAWHRVETVSAPLLNIVSNDAHGQRTLVIAGADAGPASWAAELIDAGAVVFADALSGWRGVDGIICRFDDIVRRADADLAPSAVVRFGASPASRVVHEWVAASGAHVTVVDPAAGFADHLRVADVFRRDPVVGIAPLDDETRAWARRWSDAENDAQWRASEHEDTWAEAAVVRGLTRWASGAVAELFVSSSMPIRHVEWNGPNVAAAVRSNRGANGIDGVVATAAGVARARPQGRHVGVVGDLAFRHDIGGLLAAAELGVDLAVVVIDNGGGAIFSHLPQRRLVDPATFTRLFTTPQRLDLARLACGVSDEVVEWSSWVDVDFDWLLGGGVRVAVARCEPWRKHAEPGPGIAEPDSGLLPQKGYGRTSAASIA